MTEEHGTHCDGCRQLAITAERDNLAAEVERLRSRETRIRELCESRLKNSASKVIAAIHVSRILAVLDNWAAPVGVGNEEQP